MKVFLILSAIFFFSNPAHAQVAVYPQQVPVAARQAPVYAQQVPVAARQAPVYAQQRVAYEVVPINAASQALPPNSLPNAVQISGVQPQAYVPQPRPTPAVHKVPQPQLPQNYLDKIRRRGKVLCGTNLEVKSLAYEDDGVWRGIDADFCRVLAQAIIGDAAKFAMINVKPSEVIQALDNGKIDVMLSGTPYSARIETARQALNAGLLYYDNQMVMGNVAEASSLADYQRKKMCIAIDGDYAHNFEEYNVRNDLGITFLSFNSQAKAKEAFLLKRCQLMTASGMELVGIKQNLAGSGAQILPDEIALRPVYAFVQRNNTAMQLAVKWIVNGLLLAEQYNMNRVNLTFFQSHNNPEIRNLMGDDPQLWQNLGLQPQWLREVVALLGNYADIYERNLGQDSPAQFERGKGKLLKDGGTIYPIPFI